MHKLNMYNLRQDKVLSTVAAATTEIRDLGSVQNGKYDESKFVLLLKLHCGSSCCWSIWWLNIISGHTVCKHIQTV